MITLRTNIIKQYCFILVAALCLSTSAMANERRFTYSYESGVMSPGEREMELWTTWRGGRADYYSRFDHRAEFEFGLTNRLMTAFYLNWRKITEQDPTDPRGTTSSGEFTGVSSEWKYKVLDPVANGVGLAFYQEYSVNSDEFEWENRMILDKRLGNTLLAYNLAIEPEWEFKPGHSDYEVAFENTLGVAQFLSPRLSAGLELRNHNEKLNTSTGFEHSALFLGPVISYAHDKWWVSATFMRQLPALKKSLANPQDKYILDEHEKVNIRVIASVSF